MASDKTKRREPYLCTQITAEERSLMTDEQAESFSIIELLYQQIMYIIEHSNWTLKLSWKTMESSLSSNRRYNMASIY